MIEDEMSFNKPQITLLSCLGKTLELSVMSRPIIPDYDTLDIFPLPTIFL